MAYFNRKNGDFVLWLVHTILNNVFGGALNITQGDPPVISHRVALCQSYSSIPACENDQLSLAKHKHPGPAHLPINEIKAVSRTWDHLAAHDTIKPLLQNFLQLI